MFKHSSNYRNINNTTTHYDHSDTIQKLQTAISQHITQCTRIISEKKELKSRQKKTMKEFMPLTKFSIKVRPPKRLRMQRRKLFMALNKAHISSQLYKQLHDGLTGLILHI